MIVYIGDVDIRTVLSQQSVICMTEVDQSAQIGVEACILFKLYGNKYWFIADISVEQNHFSIKVAKLLYSLKPILIIGGIVV